MKTIRCSKAKEPSFKLTNATLFENNANPWYLRRFDLKTALKKNKDNVTVFLEIFGVKEGPYTFGITHGVTQRGKKFIQIGCKRFVGVNRRALIQWAKG